MEGNVSNLHALLLYLFKKFLRPMESRSRCRGRAFLFRIDGIVPGLILKLLCDIGRKRHLSELIQNFFKNSLKVEFNNTIPVFLALGNGRRQQILRKQNLRTASQFFPRTNNTLPALIRASRKKQNFHMGSCFLLHAMKTSRNNLRIV